MDGDRGTRLRQLLETARDLPAGERAAYLAGACGDDVKLRAELEASLRAEEPPVFDPVHEPDSPAASSDATASMGASDFPTPLREEMSAKSRLGQKVGRYTLRRIIGAGGMGTVYEAVQEAPRRTVAVKIMKQGISSRSALRRFQYESQILGRLKHVGVAQIHEAGMHDDGSGGVPYFAMEYIAGGKPITEYAQAHKLGTRERLELFSKVCDAVHHGHQKGIIHRDLKPSNILVDSSGQPKIIDFGVARSTDSDMAVTTLQTDVGQLIGTLQYMSPEQCDADPHNLDIRSDVYALGVVLYELLCEELPYDVSKAAIYEAAKVIRETAPAKPSTLNRTLRGDVETITLKALDKERDRRYQSAADFGQDIERYLHDEPIEARPPSVTYQIRTFAKRNFGLFLAILTIVFLLLLGIASTTSGFVWAMREARRADGQAAAAKAAAAEARSAQNVAQESLVEARWQSYLANLRAADTEVYSNHLVSAQRYLEAAPEEYRGWEWHRLRASALTSLCVLRGHTDSVNCARFSPDGTRVVTASDDGTARVWAVDTGAMLVTLRGHRAEVLSAAFSPDGGRVLTASVDNTACIWNAATGERLHELVGHTDEVRTAEFSANGQLVLTASWDCTARIWSADTGLLRATLSGHQAGILSAVFSRTGRYVATCSSDETARVWNTITNEEVAICRPEAMRQNLQHTGTVMRGETVVFPVMDVAFLPDETAIVFGSWDATARVWSIGGAEEVQRLEGHLGVINAVQVDQNTSRIITASDDRSARIWNPDVVQAMAVLGGHDGPVKSAVFSPDGTKALTASWDETVKVWLVEAGTLAAVLREHTRSVNSASFSPDGERIVTASADGTARVWSTTPGGATVRLEGHEPGYAVDSVSISPDGMRIATASRDGTAKVWDLATAQELVTLRGHSGYLNHVAFSPDGTLVLTCSMDKTARLWNPVTGDELHVLNGHAEAIEKSAFSTDGSLVGTASWDNTARIWDVTSGTLVRVLRGHQDRVESLQFSPDGTWVVTGSDDATAIIWSVATGEERFRLKGHDSSIMAVDVSRDGRRVCTASWDGTARVWDAQSGELIAVLCGHSEPVFAAVFSPSGSQILTASGDETARLWETETGRELFTLKGHNSEVYWAWYTADGRRVFTCGADQTARVWDATTGVELIALHEIADISDITFSLDGQILAAATYDEGVRVYYATPWYERIRAYEQTKLAEVELQPVVERMLAGTATALTLEQNIRSSRSLGPTAKRGALIALSKRCNRIGGEAQSIVDRLLARHVFVANAKQALEEADCISWRVRAEVLRIIGWEVDDPTRLNERAWQIVRDPTSDGELYDLALKASLASHTGRPNSLSIALTLGVAQYRVGEYQAALELISKCDNAHGGIPEVVAFLAMTHWHLGNLDEAKVQIARLRAMMQSSEHADNEDGQLFLREAESLIEGTGQNEPSEANVLPTAADEPVNDSPS